MGTRIFKKHAYNSVKLLLTGALLFFLLMGGASNAAAQGATFNVGLSFFGPEIELYVSDIGLLAAFSSANKVGGKGGCELMVNRTIMGARYFFQGVGDSWYLGAARSQSTVVDSTNCTATEVQKEDKAGFDLLGGYHWAWGNGFNVDLGFRPGTLAIGFAF